jgi:hypothetical protein
VMSCMLTMGKRRKERAATIRNDKICHGWHA